MLQMTRIVLGVVVLTSLFAGCRGDRGGIVGCYAFFDRSGRPAYRNLDWAPATARLNEGGTATKLTPVVDSGNAEDTPGAYAWSTDWLADTVRVTFHNGRTGTQFILGFRSGSDTLQGRAIQHWEAGPPFRTDGGRASAIPIPCTRPTSGAHAG